MRVLAFTDILIKQELIEKGIKRLFPEQRFVLLLAASNAICFPAKT